MIISRCKFCEKEFNKRSSRHVFCSADCKLAYRKTHKVKHIGKCLYCGKLFEYIIDGHKPIKKYCSVSCQVKATVPTKVCTCVDCGALFLFKGRTVKLRCPICWKKHRVDTVMQYRQRKDPTVQIGVGSGGGQNSSDILCSTEYRDKLRAYRRYHYQKNASYYRKTATYKYRQLLTGNDSCLLCGFAKYQDSLVVHHIDMNRANNIRDNLVILCSNCHAHLHSVIRKKQKEAEISAELIYRNILAEVKERNEAGKSERIIRTEGLEGSLSGATHSGTSRTDMNHQEAVPE